MIAACYVGTDTDCDLEYDERYWIEGDIVEDYSCGDHFAYMEVRARKAPTDDAFRVKGYESIEDLLQDWILIREGA